MSAFRIENVVIPPGGERALITFEGGQTLGLSLSGGCCSHSFFDHDSAIDLKSIMGQTYEGACRAAEAEIKRLIRNRMAVL